MKKNDLFIILVKDGYFKKLEVLRGILSTPINGNDFIKKSDNGYLITLNDDIVEVVCDNKIPIFNINDKIELPKGCMNIVKNDIDTTIGKSIINYLILEFGLNGFGEFINREITYGEIENDIIIPAISNKELTIKDYKRSINGAVMCRSLSDMVVIAVTDKGIFPPPGLEKLKKDTIAEFNEKYGKKWVSDKKIALKYEDILVKYYMEYVSDDPTLGITTNKKMLKSIKARMLGMGIIESIDGANNDYILESLGDGIPKDKKKLVSIINNIINGSFNRSTSIQVGGVISKVLTRSSHSYKVLKTDCDVSYGLDILVTKENHKSIIGRTLVSGTKIDNDMSKSLIGSTIACRSVMYCKEKGNNVCGICAGDKLTKTKGSILLIALAIGGELVKHFLAVFHNKERKVVNIKKSDLF